MLTYEERQALRDQVDAASRARAGIPLRVGVPPLTGREDEVLAALAEKAVTFERVARRLGGSRRGVMLTLESLRARNRVDLVRRGKTYLWTVAP